MGSLVLLICVLGQDFCLAQTQTFEIDPDRSSVRFELKHMGVLKVEGEFQDFSGNFIVDGRTLQGIECQIETASIRTNDETRDKTVVSKDYLDVARFPFIDFRGEKFETAIDGNHIFGHLKIKNVERPQRLIYVMKRKGMFFQIKMSTTLSRKDYDLNFGAMNGLIGNDIEVDIEIWGKALR